MVYKNRDKFFKNPWNFDNFDDLYEEFLRNSIMVMMVMISQFFVTVAQPAHFDGPQTASTNEDPPYWYHDNHIKLWYYNHGITTLIPLQSWYHYQEIILMILLWYHYNDEFLPICSRSEFVKIRIFSCLEQHVFTKKSPNRAQLNGVCRILALRDAAYHHHQNAMNP